MTKISIPERSPLSRALGAAFAFGAASMPVAQADGNPFELSDIGTGYMLAVVDQAVAKTSPSAEASEQKSMEGKCAEGQCGAAMRGPGEASSKMPEGRCGAMDMKGMVMNENTDRLPPGCTSISEEVHISVSAGRKYASEYNGTAFGFNQHEWQVQPCSKITVTFTNDDDIRHQWMVHGLPKYIYPQGMFHMEINGPGEKTGTFIAPAEDKTFLVHCDIAQHMEKGMKAQLVVGKGDKDLPSIPGITGPYIRGGR